MEPTAMAPPRSGGTVDPQTHPVPQPSARERLQRGRPPRHKDVEVPGLGRFRLRELKQREIDDANESLARREADDKGKVITHFDNRGHRARLIAYALINDDGSNVYTDPAVTGAKEINDLLKEPFDALWATFDEVNAWSKEAKEDLGKATGKMAGAGS